MELLPKQPVFLNLEFIFSWLTLHLGNIFTPEFWTFIKGLATFILIPIIAFIFYLLVRLYEIEKESKNKKKLETITTNEVEIVVGHPTDKKRNEVWESIRSKILSDNQSEWRIAIIEADIYLDKVLDAKGFHGDTIGDKLKNLTENQLASLQIAWEAHKVRNRIAHDGPAFTITMPESRRVLSYYEIVFRDLGVIE